MTVLPTPFSGGGEGRQRAALHLKKIFRPHNPNNRIGKREVLFFLSYTSSRGEKRDRCCFAPPISIYNERRGRKVRYPRGLFFPPVERGRAAFRIWRRGKEEEIDSSNSPIL